MNHSSFLPTFLLPFFLPPFLPPFLSFVEYEELQNYPKGVCGVAKSNSIKVAQNRHLKKARNNFKNTKY